MTIEKKITSEVRALSDAIHALKEKAAKREKRKTLVFVDEKGNIHREWAKGMEAKYIDQNVMFASINPGHPDWKQYQEKKREVSILLTAKKILRSLPGDVKVDKLQKSDIKALIAQGLLRNHSKRPGRIAYGSLRRLKKMSKEIQ